jgi:hypothetical protein
MHHRDGIYLKLEEDANATREQHLISILSCCRYVAGTHIELVGDCSLQGLEAGLEAVIFDVVWGSVHEIA